MQCATALAMICLSEAKKGLAGGRQRASGRGPYREFPPMQTMKLTNRKITSAWFACGLTVNHLFSGHPNSRHILNYRLSIYAATKNAENDGGDHVEGVYMW